MPISTPTTFAAVALTKTNECMIFSKYLIFTVVRVVIEFTEGTMPVSIATLSGPSNSSDGGKSQFVSRADSIRLRKLARAIVTFRIENLLSTILILSCGLLLFPSTEEAKSRRTSAKVALKASFWTLPATGLRL